MSRFVVLLAVAVLLAFEVFARGNAIALPIFTDVVSEFGSKVYDDTFREIWGSPRTLDMRGQHVELTLDRTSSGGGFISQDRIYHGFFSAAIKVPGNYSAGVITAFYTSNENLYPKRHDEFDFEFLGVRPGKQYILQTNIFGEGVGAREERLHLWFDPTEDYHHYSILWNQYHTVFFVDSIPIREMVRSPELGELYPSKAQALYTTLWDGSAWATEGGQYPVDYDMGPYKASFKDLKVEGCVWDDAEEQPACASPTSLSLNKLDTVGYKTLSSDQRRALHWARSNFMFYSYCDDVGRYDVKPVECSSREEVTVKSTATVHRRHSSKKKQGRRGRKLFESRPVIVGLNDRGPLPPLV